MSWNGEDLFKRTLLGVGTSGGGSGGGIPQEDIDAAFAALAEKGVTVPDGATSADLDDLIASIVTGGGGNARIGTITPAENNKRLTIEHGFGSRDYNFYMISKIDMVGAYTKVISNAAAYHFSGGQSYASLLFQHSGSSHGTCMTQAANAFGHLQASNDDADENKLILSTDTGKYPLNSSFADVNFSGTYVWVVAEV